MEQGVENAPSSNTYRVIDPHQEPRLNAVSSTPLPTTNFFRSASLCANGKVALVTEENRTISVYEVPSEDPEPTEFPLVNHFNQPENVLGAVWYPTAVPEEPSVYCFLASVRECPVKLLDASNGRLRASYRIVDHRERQIAPTSMAFNSTASKIYCGFHNAIEVFDVNRPGEGERMLTTPSKKSRSGLKGIVSSLAFSPDYSGLYAAGTFSSNVVLYDETSSGAEIVLYLEGVEGPVTQVKFNPMQPHLVYATSRQSNSILSWDIRGDTSYPLQRFERRGMTNQRLNFDLDVFGTTLVTGDQYGFISCFDLTSEPNEGPAAKFKAHEGA
ncbi:hypothetical protein M422DRAFT_43897 [Sphaerobolus stellatus SS14]|nr:hypothetical protein M422DRAFT_43897 [Sphaerobolus stellatus SS14]